PEWTSLRLEYRVGESPSGQWTPLPISPGARGNRSFKPGLPGPVTVRLALRDLAGNEGVDERLVTAGGSFDRSVVSPGAITPTAPNVTLPVTGENRGQGAVRGSVTVTLPADGKIYGFHLVVKSRAGLGKSPPRPGDAPQVRIEVDTLQPEAELYAPQPEPTRS